MKTKERKKRVDGLFEVSRGFSSYKRLIILSLLMDEPKGYSELEMGFVEINVPIASSELYKHLKTLSEVGYMKKQKKKYLISSRGLKAIESAIEIMDTPIKFPKIKMTFKK